MDDPAPPPPARSSANAKSRLRAVATNVYLVMGSLAFALLALELLLRVAGPPGRELRFICYDPIMGNVYCADVEGPIETDKGWRTLRTSSDGLVDRDYPRDKPPGAYRIALLGDSMMAALTIEPALRIDKLWERGLAAQSGRPVEVINFAVQGTGTWEQVQMYRLKARNYHPDLVVLAFYWGNDVWNNLASLRKNAPNPLEDDYDAERLDRRVRTLQRDISRWFWNHSRAYQQFRTQQDVVGELVRQVRLNGWQALGRALREGVQRQAAGAAPRPLDQIGVGPEYDWESEELQLARRLILKLAALVRADGARLAVFQVPANVNVIERLPYRQMQAFLAANRIEEFDLFDLYLGQPREQFLGQFIVGDVHWNENGYRLAAAHTLPALARLLGSAAPVQATQ